MQVNDIERLVYMITGGDFVVRARDAVALANALRMAYNVNLSPDSLVNLDYLEISEEVDRARWLETVA